MKRVLGGVVGLGVIGIAAIVQAQTPTLAELARQEQARRKTIAHPTKVYTNDDVKNTTPITTMGQGTPAATESGAQTAAGQADGAAPATGAADTAGTAAAGGEAATDTAGAATAADAAGRNAKSAAVGGADEVQWRERMAAARDQLSRARLQLEAMRTRVGRLAGASVSTTSDTELAQVQRQQQETLQEYDRLRADVDRFERALTDLEAQARQAGVPPGWLR